ncbi:hypothetical protein CIHG_10331 [Coccidioides immitis H538.4]|uniref:Uncharacterized protein n=1 Tax=Coccidioides immitis H538.4 TaxID=396776 RepID=A0A0J8S6J1_COCIT|nr:hypothetical protein CIHG_10331 [Coccidioides immitis H538.4]
MADNDTGTGLMFVHRRGSIIKEGTSCGGKPFRECSPSPSPRHGIGPIGQLALPRSNHIVSQHSTSGANKVLANQQLWSFFIEGVKEIRVYVKKFQDIPNLCWALRELRWPGLFRERMQGALKNQTAH